MTEKGNIDQSAIFDFKEFGSHLRQIRRKQGFATAEDFCFKVATWTGIKISKEALYRIEKGVQPPTLEQVIAFALILFNGDGADKAFHRVGLFACLTPFANYLADTDKRLDRIPTFDGYLQDGDERIIHHDNGTEGHFTDFELMPFDDERWSVLGDELKSSYYDKSGNLRDDADLPNLAITIPRNLLGK